MNAHTTIARSDIRECDIDLTEIMVSQGIREITRYDGGFRVVLTAKGGVTGFGKTVGAAFDDASDRAAA